MAKSRREVKKKRTKGKLAKASVRPAASAAQIVEHLQELHRWQGTLLAGLSAQVAKAYPREP